MNSRHHNDNDNHFILLSYRYAYIHRHSFYFYFFFLEAEKNILYVYDVRINEWKLLFCEIKKENGDSGSINSHTRI